MSDQRSLRQLFVVGVSWSMVGYSATQLFRLGSNLILARLLSPESFGLMALINVLLIGINMVSDLGIGPNIIQSERSRERAFLDTAWTIQVVRGAILWVLCMALAYPMALFYEQPELLWLVPVAGLSALIGGLNSTKIYLAEREITFSRLIAVELFSQVVAIIAMVSIAYVWPSVWALVAGALVGSMAKMIASHGFLPGTNNRCCWDSRHARAIVKFGGWILLSTLFTFFSSSAGSMILGRFMPIADVGIFSIAVTLAKVVENAFAQVSGRTLLPLFSRLKHENEPTICKKVSRLRLGVMALFLPPLWIMVIFGQPIIEFLFDSRYHSGGWIFRLFALATIPTIIGGGVGSFVLAKGDSCFVALLSGLNLCLYIASMAIGLTANGVDGLIFGMAAHSLLMYFIGICIQWRYRIMNLRVDVLGISLSIIVVSAGAMPAGL